MWFLSVVCPSKHVRSNPPHSYPKAVSNVNLNLLRYSHLRQIPWCGGWDPRNPLPPPPPRSDHPGGPQQGDQLQIWISQWMQIYVCNGFGVSTGGWGTCLNRKTGCKKSRDTVPFREAYKVNVSQQCQKQCRVNLSNVKFKFKAELKGPNTSKFCYGLA